MKAGSMQMFVSPTPKPVDGKKRVKERSKKIRKKRGKEDKKYPIMPIVVFSFYMVRKSERGRQALWVVLFVFPI